MLKEDLGILAYSKRQGIESGIEQFKESTTNHPQLEPEQPITVV